MLSYPGRQVKTSFEIASKGIQGLLEADFKMNKTVVSKKIYSREGRIENPSLGITVFYHLASLVIPNGDPRDRFSHPTLTLMIDSYIIQYEIKYLIISALLLLHKETIFHKLLDCTIFLTKAV